MTALSLFSPILVVSPSLCVWWSIHCQLASSALSVRRECNYNSLTACCCTQPSHTTSTPAKSGGFFYLSAFLAISQLPLSQCLRFHCRYALTFLLFGWFCCHTLRSLHRIYLYFPSDMQSVISLLD